MSLESKVKFSHEVAEEAAKAPKVEEGWRFAVATKAEKAESKEKPEMPGISYKMLKTTFQPLANPTDLTSTVGRSLNNYQCLPFEGDDWDSLDEDVAKKARQNLTIFARNTHRFLQSLLSDQIPGTPRKNGDGELEYNGDVISSDQYEEKRKEAIEAAGEVAETLWNDGPGDLVQRGCYINIAYDRDANGNQTSDYPSIVSFSAEPPTDKNGVPIALVEAGTVGKPSKANGHGKTVTTKKMVKPKVQQRASARR